ncbi:MAG TPA: ThiF family adenylyltransferase [Candidatus Acidoferrales bacterium]|nr:ThiF family adenylyltransferase [Candidatus Acidoferrales bacterium]
MLSDHQIDLYSRQILLPQVGGRGQEALLNSAVLVVGDGETARTFVLYLARAGVGKMVLPQNSKLAEDDSTRVWYEAEPQLEEAFGRMPGWQLAAAFDVPAAMARQINRVCLHWRIPFLWMAAEGVRSQATVFEGYRADRPCLECTPSIRPQTRRDSSDNGSIASASLGPNVVGSWLAFEALKVLLKIDPALQGKLVEFDERRREFSETVLTKDLSCPACSNRSTVRANAAF